MIRRSKRELVFHRLQAASPAILPSLLMCDFANLELEVRRLEDVGVKALHLDVMDGLFVPNFTYGMTIVEAVRRVSQLTIDVHLMMKTPESFLKAFVDAGADCLTVHLEAVPDPQAVLTAIRDMDVVAGLAINPSTPFDKFLAASEEADLLLVMSVEAGFGGQAFQPIALERIREIRRRFSHQKLIEVDGGLRDTTIGDCCLAGADLFVVGSAIFGEKDYRHAIEKLEAACRPVISKVLD